MKVKKWLKILGIVMAILVIFLLIHTIKNYIIITGLQDKISQYSNNSNYYIKSVATEDNGTIVTMEYYKKDNKQAVFIERNLNGEISKISTYNNGERIDTFWDNKDNKIAQLNTDTFMNVNFYNCLETDYKWQTFLSSITSSIKSVNCNEKACYLIKGFMSSSYLTSKETEVYIEKDTGLLIKSTEEGILTEKEYKFDSVEDTVFSEPDIRQYTLKDKE